MEQLPLLGELECEKCKNAEWLPTVGKLKAARIIELKECGSLPSIKFLENMPKLEDFRFVDTNIVDGDLSPLLGLKWAAFSDKKHHSHTRKQIDAVLRAKGGYAIPQTGDYERRYMKQS